MEPVKRSRAKLPKQPAQKNLVAAARDGEADRVQADLAAGVDPNIPDLSGSRALYMAAANAHENVVRLLLAAGADVNALSDCLESVDRSTYHCQRSALVAAALYRHESVALLLVEHGADVNATDGFSGTTALVEAAHAGFGKLVDLLLARGARVDARNGYYNRGVLAAAAESGNARIVGSLLAHSAPLDPEALAHACRRGDVEIAELLLQAGVDPLQSRAMAASAGSGHLFLLKRLLDRDTYSDEQLGVALRSAASSGQIEAARLLLSRGAPIDAPTSFGWTPLMCAAWEEHIDIVRLLIDHGAAVAAIDTDGKTAADWAREKGRLAMVELLTTGRN
jgi:ankyrin repeat protein